MITYVFGNGNTSWEDFIRYYVPHLDRLAADPGNAFMVCDFRGVDTLTLEYLKTRTGNVSLYHVGDRPRYLPDAFRTRAGEWKLVGGFPSDGVRDGAAIEACTHFLAIDFNSDDQRKSGTLKNIEKALKIGKVAILA